MMTTEEAIRRGNEAKDRAMEIALSIGNDLDDTDRIRSVAAELRRLARKIDRYNAIPEG